MSPVCSSFLAVTLLLLISELDTVDGDFLYSLLNYLEGYVAYELEQPIFLFRQLMIYKTDI